MKNVLNIVHVVLLLCNQTVHYHLRQQPLLLLLQLDYRMLMISLHIIFFHLRDSTNHKIYYLTHRFQMTIDKHYFVWERFLLLLWLLLVQEGFYLKNNLNGKQELTGKKEEAKESGPALGKQVKQQKQYLTMP